LSAKILKEDIFTGPEAAVNEKNLKIPLLSYQTRQKKSAQAPKFAISLVSQRIALKLRLSHFRVILGFLQISNVGLGPHSKIRTSLRERHGARLKNQCRSQNRNEQNNQLIANPQPTTTQKK